MNVSEYDLKKFQTSCKPKHDAFQFWIYAKVKYLSGSGNTLFRHLVTFILPCLEKYKL